MAKKLKLQGARIGDQADSLVLVGRDKNGLTTEFEMSADMGEELLAALTTGLGQIARQRTGDDTLKKVLPTEWWEVNPHPGGQGLLFSWRIQGGMELTFHLGATAVAPFEEVLRTLSGTLEHRAAGTKN